MFVALIRGEFKELWSYSEEHLVKPNEHKKEKQSPQQQQKSGKKDKKND
jgi:hypothetical protein